MKKFLAIVCLFALLTAVGCGGKDTKSTGTPSTEKKDTPASKM